MVIDHWSGSSMCRQVVCRLENCMVNRIISDIYKNDEGITIWFSCTIKLFEFPLNFLQILQRISEKYLHVLDFIPGRR